ncbi:hypothetical protein NDU88_000888 [Pleurodeles waltl]|uniref:Secreted protein n=1 Tax=Pleurodeles waltl TaxID=8319 RepID=A0AAV7KQL3_PLEWA|nr:hypothetical protein NDU88_000888 [Pleurodeles waltl]
MGRGPVLYGFWLSALLPELQKASLVVHGKRRFPEHSLTGQHILRFCCPRKNRDCLAVRSALLFQHSVGLLCDKPRICRGAGRLLVGKGVEGETEREQKIESYTHNGLYAVGGVRTRWGIRNRGMLLEK